MQRSYRYIFRAIFAVLILTASCKSFDSISEEKSKLERAKAVYLLDTAVQNVLEVTYNQGGVDVNMHLNLNEHEFQMEFDKGTSSSSPLNVATTSVGSGNNQILSPSGQALPAKSPSNLKTDMSKVIYAYNLAQTRFYQKDYEGSLASLDSSIAIMPTSDAYALKGSILFVLKEYDLAQFYWSEAKKLNPNFEMPTVIRR